MSTPTDWRAVCVELVEAWRNGRDIWCPMNRARTLLSQPEPVALTDQLLIGLMPMNLLADEEDALVAMRAAIAADHAHRARTAPSQPEPVAPTDEELEDLAAQMAIEHRGDQRSYAPFYARAVLTRWGTPTIQPVPVSERLPGPDDCNDDSEVWIQEGGIQEQYFDESSWVPSAWVMREYESSDERRKAPWLPHWALPVPQQPLT